MGAHVFRNPPESRELTGSDQWLITLTDAKGETVAYHEIPMDQLPADQS